MKTTFTQTINIGIMMLKHLTMHSFKAIDSFKTQNIKLMLFYLLMFFYEIYLCITYQFKNNWIAFFNLNYI